MGAHLLLITLAILCILTIRWCERNPGHAWVHAIRVSALVVLVLCVLVMVGLLPLLVVFGGLR